MLHCSSKFRPIVSKKKFFPHPEHRHARGSVAQGFSLYFVRCKLRVAHAELADNAGGNLATHLFFI